MDFFAGSGTLAQAVYEINKEDKANLDYTLVQLNENIDINSDVYQKCLSLGVNPNMKDIILYRLNTFLENNGMEKDYDLVAL